MRHSMIPVAALLIFGVPTVMHAQRADGTRVTPGSMRDTMAIVPASQAASLMKSALRDLVVREEAHWMAHGTYTTDMSMLGTYNSARTSSKDSAFVQVIFAGSRGWTGMAMHAGAKGKSCVIFIGSADELPRLPATLAEKKTPHDEAAPLCDAL